MNSPYVRLDDSMYNPKEYEHETPPPAAPSSSEAHEAHTSTINAYSTLAPKNESPTPEETAVGHNDVNTEYDVEKATHEEEDDPWKSDFQQQQDIPWDIFPVSEGRKHKQSTEEDDEGTEEWDCALGTVCVLSFIAFFPLQAALVYIVLFTNQDLRFLIGCPVLIVLSFPGWYITNKRLLRRGKKNDSSWGIVEVLIVLFMLPIVLYLCTNLFEYYTLGKPTAIACKYSCRGILYLCDAFYNHILSPIGSGIRWVCHQIYAGLRRCYYDCLLPFGYAIRLAWNWVYQEFIAPTGHCFWWIGRRIYLYLLAPIGKGINWICTQLYTYILSPIGNGVKWIFTKLYQYLIRPVALAIGWMYRQLSRCIKWICSQFYQYMLRPVGLGIKWVCNCFYQYILSPVGSAIGWICSKLGQGIQCFCSAIYNNILAPVGRLFRTIYNAILRGIRRVFGGGT